ncbi:hypothetical protein BS47DRAFT_1361234 [Hydnum rufescens UP504]|uniref:Uncharacterized protein n=1 Tax=Hydnum rufescens UP504 TaxID=1448309 RepID=A0A9P6DUA7_9AGAM|nr:hypothetical protein BS47DRAFT_1361234 [Hydnum rufescens UP504]
MTEQGLDSPQREVMIVETERRIPDGPEVDLASQFQRKSEHKGQDLGAKIDEMPKAWVFPSEKNQSITCANTVFESYQLTLWLRFRTHGKWHRVTWVTAGGLAFK